MKKAQTLTEKILARHSNNASVAPGQNIWTNVDKLMTHDVCGPGTFGIFQREFGENAQVQAPRVPCFVVWGSLLKGVGLFAEGRACVCQGSASDWSAVWPQVWDPERVVIIPDHYIFTSDPRANRNVDILRCPHNFIG